jgi:hypothetical protein
VRSGAMQRIKKGRGAADGDSLCLGGLFRHRGRAVGRETTNKSVWFEVFGGRASAPRSLDQRPENDARPNQDQQDGEHRHVQAKDIAQPGGQCQDAQENPEPAGLELVEETDHYEPQYDQPRPEEPGAFRDPSLIGHQQEAADH